MTQVGNLYADLSEYYDQFCADVDYKEQCNFAMRIFSVFASASGKEYLDLACGTGQHLLQMQDYDFTLHGLDNSAAMLELAAQRCPQATLQLCDMADFQQKNCYDLITCFLYSLHYSHPVCSVIEALKRCFSALKPGGVFLFNAVDARGIKNNEGITTSVKTEKGNLRFQSGWNYKGTGDVLDLHLKISLQSEHGIQHWNDHHTMTALTFPQLEELLIAAGFQVTLLEHDYSKICSWNKKSFNGIFVAYKPMV